MTSQDPNTKRMPFGLPSVPSVWEILRHSLTRQEGYSANGIVRVILVSFFLSFLYSALSASSPILETIVLNIHTDDFPQETSWILSDGNTYEVLMSSEDLFLQPNTLYSDTISIEDNQCIRLSINDDGGDGFQGAGFFELYFGPELVQSNHAFTAEFNNYYNCTEALVCEEAIPLNDGSELLKNAMNSWFVVRPINDTYYMMRTTSSCDTKMWIYDACGNDHPTDLTGAILFSDDLDGKAAGFNQIRLEGDQEYFVRIENDSLCNETTFFYIVDLKLREGCMDPTSCSFDPLANLDNGSCTYGDCNPDLAINKEELIASIYLDSFVNDNECLIVEGCLQGYGKRDIIRFTTQIDNVGDADYIVGEPQDESPLFSEENCHQHWHYLGYAEYLLFDGNDSAQPVGFKNGFCALDYRCENRESYKYDCNYMGISAGCSDTYEHDILCQWIDITDVVDGTYTMVVRVNYNQAPDFFGRAEADFENNWAQVCVKIDRSSGQLKLEILDSCPEYTDCLGFKFGNTQVDCKGICGGVAHYGDINEDQRVDQSDLAEYERYLQEDNSSITSCLDLSGDGLLSIYDISLLNTCLINNPYDEQDPLHTHCDFPQSLTNPGDTIVFRLGEYIEAEGALVIEYKSNVSFVALDIQLNGLRVDSVKGGESIDFLPLIHVDRIAGMTKNPEFSFDKSSDFQPLFKVYFKVEDHLEACISNIVDVINTNQEKMITQMDPTCISLITTAINDPHLIPSFEINPNPATNVIYLENLQDLDIKKWAIYDARGNLILVKKITSKSPVKIKLESISAGYYFVRINTDQGQFVRSFIKL